MIKRLLVAGRAWIGVGVTAVALAACSTSIAGTPTWPGAALEKALLSESDFPAGVAYDRILDDPSQPDGAGGPPIMQSRPAGCSDGLTEDIAAGADRGPGAAAKFLVQYDGARILMTVLSSELDLDRLAQTASRCERFEVFFDPGSLGIPITTTKLPTSHPDALAYRQTMRLGGVDRSVYASFENVGGKGVFGVAFDAPNPTIAVKASLPQTFLDIVAKQGDRLRSG